MSSRKNKNRNLTKKEESPQKLELSFLAAFRKSPFPPPAELEKYEALYPGVTKLLFDNFAKQTTHRIELEKTVIEGDNKRANIAQHYSFFITLAFLILSGFLFYNGKNIEATVAAITGIVPVIISFINSSVRRKEEREIKRRNIGISQ